jgi:copper(I)-binding protein
VKRAARLLLLVAACTAVPAGAVDIKLSSAWMRPAPSGSDARAYVDIASDTPLTLVGATTPVARQVQIVVVKSTDGTDPGRIVKSLPVTADKPTRLAYKGNHLRLVGLKQDVPNGTSIPVTLQFTGAGGKRYTAKADVSARGLLMHGDDLPPPAGAAAPKAKKGL